MKLNTSVKNKYNRESLFKKLLTARVPIYSFRTLNSYDGQKISNSVEYIRLVHNEGQVWYPGSDSSRWVGYAVIKHHTAEISFSISHVQHVER